MLLGMFFPMSNVLNDQVTLKLVDIFLTTCDRCYFNPRVNRCHSFQKSGRLNAPKSPKLDL